MLSKKKIIQEEIDCAKVIWLRLKDYLKSMKNIKILKKRRGNCQNKIY